MSFRHSSDIPKKDPWLYEHVSDEFKMLRQNWDMTQAIHTNMSFDKKFEVVRCIPITWIDLPFQDTIHKYVTQVLRT